jgi:Barstar (barnase inhibitor)
MDALCTRLQDANEAGAYRLNCLPDELRAAVAQVGFALFEVDLAAAQGKGEFLAAVAHAISAPDWFGHNFDALADALGDLSWRPAPGYVLLLRNGGDALGLGAAEHGIVMSIFADVARYWKSQGKPFWIFFDDVV